MTSISRSRRRYADLFNQRNPVDTITVINIEQGDKNSWPGVANICPGLVKDRWKNPPFKFTHLPVPNYDQSENGDIPAVLLRDEVAKTEGKMIVVGNSTGNHYANEAAHRGYFDDVDPTRLTFWQLANPERPYGGWTTVPAPLTAVSTKLFGAGWDIFPFDREPGLPPAMTNEVHDLAQRYDPVADAATAAHPESNFGYLGYAVFVGLLLHLNYFSVSPEDRSWFGLGGLVTKKRVEGNRTYYLHSPFINPAYETLYSRPPEFR